jgi:hypothetical protein
MLAASCDSVLRLSALLSVFQPSHSVMRVHATRAPVASVQARPREYALPASLALPRKGLSARRARRCLSGPVGVPAHARSERLSYHRRCRQSVRSCARASMIGCQLRRTISLDSPTLSLADTVPCSSKRQFSRTWRSAVAVLAALSCPPYSSPPVQRAPSGYRASVGCMPSTLRTRSWAGTSSGFICT